MPIWLWEWEGADNIRPHYLKDVLQIYSIIITWALVINAEPQAPSQTYWICILTRSSSDLQVHQSLRSIGCSKENACRSKVLEKVGGDGVQSIRENICPWQKQDYLLHSSRKEDRESEGTNASGPMDLVNERGGNLPKVLSVSSIKRQSWERNMEGVIASYKREEQVWNSPLRTVFLNLGCTLESPGELW